MFSVACLLHGESDIYAFFFLCTQCVCSDQAVGMQSLLRFCQGGERGPQAVAVGLCAEAFTRCGHDQCR